MRCLLDTHALAWWLVDDPRLGRSAHSVISEASNEIFVSAVSAFEAATKLRIGKWPEIAALVADFETIVLAERFSLMPLSAAAALLAGRMPGEHKDPFDRLLAAQCKLEGLSLITIDAAFTEFGIDVIW